MIRTLPIRVRPVEGEALDSWIEATAVRLDTPLGDVLAQLGLTGPLQSPPDGTWRTERRDWTVELLPREAEIIAEVTGVEIADLRRLTLARYHGTALLIDEATGLVKRSVLWGRARGSRYCPECLTASKGRWMLRWRLPWYFACLDHRCLLADGCTRCGRDQRQYWTPRHLVPRPNHCHRRLPAVDRTIMERCYQDLASQATLHMAADHPCLAAQRIVHSMIEAGAADFGIYASNPLPVDQVLADIRALSLRILDSDSTQLDDLVPSDVVRAHRSARDSAPPLCRPGYMAPRHAVTAAATITAAVRTIGQDDIVQAAAVMRDVLQQIGTAPTMDSATSIDAWSIHTSSALKSAYLAALGPSLRPRYQLRYRTATEIPTRTLTPPKTLNQRGAKLPSMLWPAWAIRIGPPSGIRYDTLQSVLPVLVLLVGSDLEHRQAIERLASVTNQLSTVRILQRLSAHPQWQGIHTALVRLADFLDTAAVPIDYDRRRSLNYERLLCEDQWANIARAAGIARGRAQRARLARIALFQKLSGLPASMAPSDARATTYDAPTHVAHFAIAQTPQVALALESVGTGFLAANGIHDEPVEWQPPMSVLDGLDLPGPDLQNIDLASLHDLIRSQGLELRATAERLGTTYAAVYHLLDRNPAKGQAPTIPDRRHPKGGTTPPQPTPRRAAQQARHDVREALPLRFMKRLYEEEHHTFGQIAEITGFSIRTISRLARDYGLQSRGSEDYRRRGVVDRDWLYEQYVIRQRTIPELAREKGMSTMNMNRWAHRLDIPLRPRGGGSNGKFLRKQGN